MLQFLKCSKLNNIHLGHNSSFVWCSIHTSWIVIKEGLKWRIGNDNSIKVWSQPQLNFVDNCYIISPIIAGHKSLLVSTLIDQQTKNLEERCSKNFTITVCIVLKVLIITLWILFQTMNTLCGGCCCIGAFCLNNTESNWHLFVYCEIAKHI